MSGKIVIAQCMDRCGQKIDHIGRRDDDAIAILICNRCSVRYFRAQDLPDNLIVGILREESRYRAFISRSENSSKSKHIFVGLRIGRY